MKKFLSCFSRGTLTLLFFGVLLICFSAKDTFDSLKPAVSFQDLLDGTEVKEGARVAGNVVYAMDYFASETSYTQYSDGSRSGDRESGNYYLIPTATGYIGLKSRQADVFALNDLSEETSLYLTEGTEPHTEIYMQGIVTKMGDELTGYYCDYLGELGYSEAEIQAMGQPLLIDYISFGAVRVFFILGIALIALAFFLMWRRYKRTEKRLKNMKSVDDLPDRPIEQM